MKHRKLWAGLGAATVVVGGAALVLFGPWAKYTNPLWMLLRAGGVSARQVQTEKAEAQQALGYDAAALLRGTRAAEFTLTLDGAEGEGMLLGTCLLGAETEGSLALDAEHQSFAAAAEVSLARQTLFDAKLTAKQNVAAFESDLFTAGERLGAHTETFFADYNASAFGQNKGIDTAQAGFSPWMLAPLAALGGVQVETPSVPALGWAVVKALWNGGLRFAGEERYSADGAAKLACDVYTAAWDAQDAAPLFENAAQTLRASLTAEGAEETCDALLARLTAFAARLRGEVTLRLYVNSGRLVGAAVEVTQSAAESTAPSAQTGTESAASTAQTGTESAASSARTGMENAASTAQTGTESAAPSAQTGTESAAPSAQTGTEEMTLALQFGRGGESSLSGRMALCAAVTAPDGQTRRTVWLSQTAFDAAARQCAGILDYSAEENGVQTCSVSLDYTAARAENREADARETPAPQSEDTADSAEKSALLAAFAPAVNTKGMADCTAAAPQTREAEGAALRIALHRASAAWQTEQGLQRIAFSGAVTLDAGKETAESVDTGITEALRFPLEESAEQQTALKKEILKSMMVQVWQKPALRTVLWDYAMQRAAEVFSDTDLTALLPGASGGTTNGTTNGAADGTMDGALQKLQDLWSGLQSFWTQNAAG